eukprot:Nk52_evm60s158 gene=Nk52_evmTU60s158
MGRASYSGGKSTDGYYNNNNNNNNKAGEGSNRSGGGVGGGGGSSSRRRGSGSGTAQVGNDNIVAIGTEMGLVMVWELNLNYVVDHQNQLRRTSVPSGDVGGGGEAITVGSTSSSSSAAAGGGGGDQSGGVGGGRGGGVWYRNAGKKGKKKERMVALLSDHRPESIAHLKWDEDGRRLFSADTKGRVMLSLPLSGLATDSLIGSSTGGGAGGASHLLKSVTTGGTSSTLSSLSSTITSLSSSVSSATAAVSSEEIFSSPDGSAIVQLDFKARYLLVSTWTRCHVLDTKGRTATMVGKKKREGRFGGCFRECVGPEGIVVYAARPGTRLWEADVVGTVLSTTNFKQELASKQTWGVPTFELEENINSQTIEADSNIGPSTPKGTLQFGRICALPGGLVLSWSESQLYVLSPNDATVVEYHTSDPLSKGNACDLSEIESVSICGSEIYLLHANAYNKGVLEKGSKFITKLTMEFPGVVIKRALKMGEAVIAHNVISMLFHNVAVEQFCKTVHGDLIGKVISLLEKTPFTVAGGAGESLMQTGDEKREVSVKEKMIRHLREIIISVQTLLEDSKNLDSAEEKHIPIGREGVKQGLISEEQFISESRKNNSGGNIHVLGGMVTDTASLSREESAGATEPLIDSSLSTGGISSSSSVASISTKAGATGVKKSKGKKKGKRVARVMDIIDAPKKTNSSQPTAMPLQNNMDFDKVLEPSASGRRECGDDDDAEVSFGSILGVKKGLHDIHRADLRKGGSDTSGASTPIDPLGIAELTKSTVADMNKYLMEHGAAQSVQHSQDMLLQWLGVFEMGPEHASIAIVAREVRELFTTCFTLGLYQSSSVLSNVYWNEDGALGCIERYYHREFLDREIVLQTCVKYASEKCIRKVMEREDRVDTNRILCTAIERHLGISGNVEAVFKLLGGIEQIVPPLYLTLKYVKRIIDMDPKSAIDYILLFFPYVNVWCFRTFVIDEMRRQGNEESKILEYILYYCRKFLEGLEFVDKETVIFSLTGFEFSLSSELQGQNPIMDIFEMICDYKNLFLTSQGCTHCDSKEEYMDRTKSIGMIAPNKIVEELLSLEEAKQRLPCPGSHRLWGELDNLMLSCSPLFDSEKKPLAEGNGLFPKTRVTDVVCVSFLSRIEFKPLKLRLSKLFWDMGYWSGALCMFSSMGKDSTLFQNASLKCADLALLLDDIDVVVEILIKNAVGTLRRESISSSSGEIREGLKDLKHGSKVGAGATSATNSDCVNYVFSCFEEFIACNQSSDHLLEKAKKNLLMFIGKLSLRMDPSLLASLVGERETLVALFPSSAFSTLTEIVMASDQQEEIFVDMLRVLNKNLWGASASLSSGAITSVHPQLAYVNGLEVLSADCAEKDASSNLPYVYEGTSNLKFEYTRPARRYIDSLPRDWGHVFKDISGSRCPQCKIGLEVEVDGKGLSMYICGHVLHAHCSSVNGRTIECPTCKRQTSNSFYYY